MKRLFDLFFSSATLLLLSPLLVIIICCIVLFQGTPVFFLHKRLGKNHKKFHIYKFCTMKNTKDENGKLLSDKDRTTKLGSFLRKTSIDELPGFVNVLIGDMSVVGPRPLPPQYLERYSKEQDKRHEVKPGITGWAQINGRNAISWEEKFKYDLWYVKNNSFYVDMKIILLTINYVLSRKDIVPYNKDAMEEFLGTNKNIDQ